MNILPADRFVHHMHAVPAESRRVVDALDWMELQIVVSLCGTW